MRGYARRFRVRYQVIDEAVSSVVFPYTSKGSIVATTSALIENASAQAANDAIAEVSAAEQRAHSASTRSDIQGVAAGLNPIFGRDLLAVMTNVQNPRTVTQWVRGESAPHAGTGRVLRDVAYVATLLLESGMAKETVQAWFIGMNPHLRGHSPATTIRNEPRLVLNAAKAFVQYS
jgi:hypothetical protein